MNESDAIQRMIALCFQYDAGRIQQLKESRRKLAHYTTAESGLKIIQGKTIWLRNAALMNDFSEIQHGRDCLKWAFENTDALSRLSGVFEPHHPGLLKEVLDWLNSAELDSRLFTYMTAVAEHLEDDELGKLSMWRAYGGNAGVALVLNTDFLDANTVSLQAATSPVLYGGPQQVADEMIRTIERLEAEPDVIARTPRANAQPILFNAFRYAILSTKHPGFAEECEWRVLHSPRQLGSAFIKPETVTIRGIAQLVYKLPLENHPGMSFPEVELDRLLYRVIIGPTEFPTQIAEAFEHALAGSSVQNPGDRIRLSRIPLRHTH